MTPMNNHMVVDLSSDEDDDKKDNFSDWLDEFLEVSNEKPKSTNSSDPMVEIKDEDDDDCVILDSDPMAKETVIDTIETDEVLVTGQKGEIACRDFPHPRHDCAKYQFKTTLHQQHCDMCHCYVCDTRAPCPYWYSGVSSVDHCHANNKEDIWKNQRECIRTGNTLPRPDSIIGLMGRVTKPRSVRVSHNPSSPLTQFGVRACSKSTKVATHPNQRDGSYMLSKPSPKKAVSSSPYLRPSRRTNLPGSGVQNIAQGSQATHYTPPPALQVTRTAPPMVSQAARYAPPVASQAPHYAPPPALQATSTNPPLASQAARNAPPMATRYTHPLALQATSTNPPVSQATGYAPPAASQATRNAAPSALQATRSAPSVASQATHYAPLVASQATRISAPPAASQATRSAPSVASQATRYAPPVASTHSATHYASPVASQATRSAPPVASQATRSAPHVASQATRYAPPLASQATLSAFPQASQATHRTLPAASQTIRNAPPVASQPTHSASPAASQATRNAPPTASQATPNAPPRASQGNQQRIVTGYISTVPESPSKVYARRFNQKMYSANLQTNAVMSKSLNPPANQRQQQSGISNDKLLLDFEDWLLDDSTPAGSLCPLVGQRQC